MITCAHNIAAQAEPQLVINVSCTAASKQTFSSKADVKLCATNALILVHDDVISMRMILEAEKTSQQRAIGALAVPVAQIVC